MSILPMSSLNKLIWMLLLLLVSVSLSGKCLRFVSASSTWLLIKYQEPLEIRTTATLLDPLWTSCPSRLLSQFSALTYGYELLKHTYMSMQPLSVSVSLLIIFKDLRNEEEKVRCRRTKEGKAQRCSLIQKNKWQPQSGAVKTGGWNTM